LSARPRFLPRAPQRTVNGLDSRKQSLYKSNASPLTQPGRRAPRGLVSQFLLSIMKLDICDLKYEIEWKLNLMFSSGRYPRKAYVRNWYATPTSVFTIGCRADQATRSPAVQLSYGDSASQLSSIRVPRRPVWGSVRLAAGGPL
jgi:hypothetical protein